MIAHPEGHFAVKMCRGKVFVLAGAHFVVCLKVFLPNRLFYFWGPVLATGGPVSLPAHLNKRRSQVDKLLSTGLFDKQDGEGVRLGQRCFALLDNQRFLVCTLLF